MPDTEEGSDRVTIFFEALTPKAQNELIRDQVIELVTVVVRDVPDPDRPDDRLADLDWKDIPMDFGPPAEKRFPVAKAKNLIESAGFRILSVQDAGPYHYLIVASP
jgi:hypothetical protein